MNTHAQLGPLASEPIPMSLGGTAATPSNAREDFSANVRLLWSAFYRRRYLVAAIVILTMVLGVVVTMLTTPMFLANASVQIDQQASKVLDNDDTDPVPAIQDADRFLQTQVDILNSRELAIRVMNSLNLQADDHFLDLSGVDPVKARIVTLSPADSRRELVLRELETYLSVTLPRNSRIVQIGFKSPHAILAARIANSFALNFIQSNLQRHFDTSAYARSFLNDQLAATKQRLQDSEQAMISYAGAEGLIDVSAGTVNSGDSSATPPRSLVTSNLIKANDDLAIAQTARVQAQQRWEQALKTPLLSLPEVLNNAAILGLQEQRAQAQAAYQQELQRRQPGYPVMRQAAAQLAELDNQINGLALNIRNSIRDTYLVAARQEGALNGTLGQLKIATISEQNRSVRYNILAREVDTNREMYDALLQRYKEVSAAAGLAANNISLIDQAEAPIKAVSPKPLLNLAAALVLGFALAGAAVLLLEKFDDAIRSPDDVTSKLGLTLLNTIPLLKNNESPLDAMADPRSAISESYAALRTALELVTPAGLPRSMLFTSSRQAEGKSTSAYAVARNFASLGRRVVLIDADLRKPSLHRVLGLGNNAGFSSLLARHKGLAEVTQVTDMPELYFISSGPLPPNPAELLSGSTLPMILRELGEHFDLIVIDGPPVLGLADAILLASNTEGTVFVIEANGSHHGHAKAAIRRLTASGATLIGVLLTKFDARKIGYGDEYGYYSYSYGLETGDGPTRAG